MCDSEKTRRYIHSTTPELVSSLRVVTQAGCAMLCVHGIGTESSQEMLPWLYIDHFRQTTQHLAIQCVGLSQGSGHTAIQVGTWQGASHQSMSGGAWRCPPDHSTVAAGLRLEGLLFSRCAAAASAFTNAS